VGTSLGVLIAIASSALGGTAAAVTRYLVGGVDPVTLALLRWGIGLACILPVALLMHVRWPKRGDWVAVGLLGAAFFGLFFIFFNLAISYTTAARASLALSTLPLQTMIVGALFRIERLTARKIAGVAIAMIGVVVALASDVSVAPPGAWRGELIMMGAVLCMAFYNIWSRPFIERSSALGYLTMGMSAGVVVLLVAGASTGSLTVLAAMDLPGWTAAIYLGIAGGALAFILWVLALERASPTLVANTMTVNPIAASLLAAQLLNEPITVNLGVGLIAVIAGILIATTSGISPVSRDPASAPLSAKPMRPRRPT
jgi:drug/metabolite transporter (DMT)-like permease